MWYSATSYDISFLYTTFSTITRETLLKFLQLLALPCEFSSIALRIALHDSLAQGVLLMYPPVCHTHELLLWPTERSTDMLCYSIQEGAIEHHDHPKLYFDGDITPRQYGTCDRIEPCDDVCISTTLAVCAGEPYHAEEMNAERNHALRASICDVRSLFYLSHDPYMTCAPCTYVYPHVSKSALVCNTTTSTFLRLIQLSY